MTGFFDINIPKIKETFGFGAMKPDEELTEAIVDNNNNNNSTKGHDSFEWGIRRGISEFLLEFIKPWFDHCVRTYTEQQFHEKMAAGFDLYEDWQVNHTERYRRLVNTGRRMRRFIDIDEARVARIAADRLEQHGWTVYASEVEQIRQAIVKVKADVFR